MAEPLDPAALGVASALKSLRTRAGLREDRLHGTELAGNNGIEISPDEKELYIAVSGTQTVAIYNLADTSKPARTIRNSGKAPILLRSVTLAEIDASTANTVTPLRSALVTSANASADGQNITTTLEALLPFVHSINQSLGPKRLSRRRPSTSRGVRPIKSTSICLSQAITG